MSTRALRKAQKLREQQTELEKQSADDAASEEEEADADDITNGRNKQSAFAMLNDAEDDAAEDEEEDEPDLSRNEYVKHDLSLISGHRLL